MDDGRFHPEHTALLIVDFDRIAVDSMAQSNSLWALLESGGHLTAKAFGICLQVRTMISEHSSHPASVESHAASHANS